MCVRNLLNYQLFQLLAVTECFGPYLPDIARNRHTFDTSAIEPVAPNPLNPVWDDDFFHHSQLHQRYLLDHRARLKSDPRLSGDFGAIDTILAPVVNVNDVEALASLECVCGDYF